MSGCAGNDPYALRVLGDSMNPEFPDGSIVIVEPGGTIESGCYVVAECNDEYVLRQLRIENERWFLSPLNESFPQVEISGIEAIKGRVIQRAGRRRRDRKFYV